MAQLFKNNAVSKLTAAIDTDDTSIVVESGEGAVFPAISGGDYFLLTLVGLDNGKESVWEIVKVIGRVGDTLTITRAQDNTTARSWGIGTVCELRLTAAALDDGFITDAERTKLNGIEASANNYVHPSSHSPSIITQDSSNRFVTDTEKATWNGKASTSVATTSTNGLMSSADKSKLDGVASGANNYTHPAVHSPSIISQDANNRFVTDTEKTTWNGKASTSVATTSVNGLMSSTDKTKLDGVAASANNYTHPANHPASIITQDSSNRFVTDTEKTTWNGKASTSVATTSTNGLMSSTDKTKLDGVAASANNYTHPTGDGNLHVPLTSTSNNGKVLKAGSTAGSLSWGTLTATDVGAAATSHTHTVSQVSDWPTAVTMTEVGYLDGVTSAIQTQIGTKLNATNPVIYGSITEGVHALSGTTPALNPANGTIQTWTLSGNSTPTNGFTANGQSMTLMVNAGSSYTITWPTIKWFGGAAPTLATAGYNVIELWCVGAALYGAYLGDV